MTFKFPAEFVNYYPDSEKELLYTIKIVYAIDLYLQEKVTIMKAAELCDLTLKNFIGELKNGVFVVKQVLKI